MSRRIRCIRRIAKRLSFVVALGVAALPPLAAGVTVRPPAVDFGSRGHNESPQMTIELTNDFPSPVRITRLKPSCSCIKVSPTAFAGPLPPGGTVRVTVTMSSGRAFGKVFKYIELEIGGDAGAIAAVRVPVSMTVFEQYDMEPKELRFEGAYGGSPVTASALLQAKRKAPGRPLDLKFVRIRDLSRRLPAIEQYFAVKVTDHPQGATLAVTLSPQHPEGRVWGELEARLDGKPLVLPIAGDMFRGILLSPRYLNFNRVEAGKPETHVEEAALRAIDGHAFKILGMTSQFTRPKENPGFTVELEADPRPDGREHAIRARVVAPGGFPLGSSFSGKVTVRTTHPEKPQVELGFFGFFARD